MKHAILICEGYQDRAFFSEWVEALGVQRLRENARPPFTMKDAHWKAAPSGLHLGIAPARGVSNVPRFTADILKIQGAALARALVVIDSDGKEADVVHTGLRQALATAAGEAPPPAADAVQSVHGVEVRIAVCHPRLESLLEAALRAADPTAMGHVDGFLNGANLPAPGTGKEPSFTWCAAWRPDSFGEAFFGQFWREPALRRCIEAQTTSLRAALDWLTAHPAPTPRG